MRLVKNDGVILDREHELASVPVECVAGQEGRRADQEEAQQAPQWK